MRIYDGKQYREATPEEEAKYNIPEPSKDTELVTPEEIAQALAEVLS